MLNVLALVFMSQSYCRISDLIYFGWAWQESFALHLISGISHLFKSSFVSEIYLVKHVAQSLKPRYSQHCL